MNFSRLNVLYWTDNLTNQNNDGTTIVADISKTFRSNLLERASDWVCAVERMELNLNGIPYYDGDYQAEQLQLYGTGENIDGVEYDRDTVYQTINLNFKSWSLKNTVDQLNELLASQAIGSPTQAGNWSFELDADGFITLSRDNSDKYRSVFGERINQILGLFNEVSDSADWISSEPRWDCGDALQHIRLSSNLNLVSDTVGQAKTNIVTDVSVGSSLSASSSGGFSYNSREKLLYTPSKLRYLNFNSSAPVQTLRIFCEYIMPDGTSRVVQLPNGSSFNIKIGFYQKI
jgi:hypothetical protein